MNTQPDRYEVYNELGKGQEEKEEMLLSRTEYLMPAPFWAGGGGSSLKR